MATDVVVLSACDYVSSSMFLMSFSTATLAV